MVNLNPTFVVPTGLEAGDNFLFDGSVTDSTLMIHNGAYLWSFGDGTAGTSARACVTGTPPRATTTVTLSVTDRGGNTATVTQTVPGARRRRPAGSVPRPGLRVRKRRIGQQGSALKVRLQLLPQSLKAVLQSGIKLRVTSNKAANGIATVWITRISAKKAHIKTGKGAAVRIGIGTVSSITNGTVTLRLHLSPAMAKKLATCTTSR